MASLMRREISGMVLVDDGDRGIVDLELGAGRHRIHGVAECVYDQHQHDRVGADAVQFLDAERQNVGEPLSHQGSCFLRIRLASGNEGEDESGEDQVIEPKLGEAEPLVEGSHADLLEPGCRESEADELRPAPESEETGTSSPENWNRWRSVL